MESALTKRLVELYLSNTDLLNEGQSAILNAPRRAAIEAFNLAGVPVKGAANGDRYHYTSLKETFDQEWEFYFTPSAAGVQPENLPGEMLRMKFVNGFCCDARRLVCRPDGVVYGSLAAAVRECPQLVEHYYNRLCAERGDAVAQLTTAFVQDGAFVYVPCGVQVDEPFAVECGLYGRDEAVASFGRNLFIFEAGSAARLVIDYTTLSDERLLGCRTREVFLERGAQLEMIEVCRLNERSSLISQNFASQQQESLLHSVSVTLGAGMMRNERHVLLEGPGAENHTNGLMVASGTEWQDCETEIEHRVPDCTSHQLFKAVAEGCGTTVFGGRIFVAPAAQRTQAFQQNNNLVLGDNAHAYTQPQLEIYADDVKCSHGATVGQLDREAIYYMRQRGISLENARRLQMYGFALDVLSESRLPQLNEWIAGMLAVKIDRL